MKLRSGSLHRWMIVVAIVTITCSASAQDADVMTPAQINGFVGYLEQLGEYRRAGYELERLLSGTSQPSDSLPLRINSLYVQAGEYSLAEATLRRAIQRAPEVPSPELRYQLASTLYRQQRYADAATVLDSLNRYLLPTSSGGRLVSAHLLRSLCSAEQQQWDEARKGAINARGTAAGGPQQQAVDSIIAVIDMAGSIPMRSPLLAGVLSTLVPGLGKVYTGHPTDGLLSLISIATFAYASYDGFATSGSSSVRGWIFGTLAGGLYLGNIYGSALSASIVRDEATRQLQTRLRLSFSLAGVP